jgi:hypothetical protein
LRLGTERTKEGIEGGEPVVDPQHGSGLIEVGERVQRPVLDTPVHLRVWHGSQTRKREPGEPSFVLGRRGKVSARAIRNGVELEYCQAILVERCGVHPEHRKSKRAYVSRNDKQKRHPDSPRRGRFVYEIGKT